MVGFLIASGSAATEAAEAAAAASRSAASFCLGFLAGTLFFAALLLFLVSADGGIQFSALARLLLGLLLLFTLAGLGFFQRAFAGFNLAFGKIGREAVFCSASAQLRAWPERPFHPPVLALRPAC